ncbi:hypothetical protein [Luteolibacter sp. LG18]|uniref:hypothetical protein n=1 Tax=Luteolibacter sp. LG18 TaxID=2819286 RepID=UPI002B2CDA8D|nr:hypothetical protein llg_32260 [Luteolibacter sp. LG18]
MKLLPLCFLLGCSLPAGAAVLATFSFTNSGGVPSLVPTLGAEAIAAGITVGNFTLGSGAGNPTDQGASNTLLITGMDTAGSTATALGLNNYYSFTINIPADKVVTLSSLTMNFTGTNLFYDVNNANGHNARVYSSIGGFDDVTGDTLGRVGYIGTGNAPVEAVTLGAPFATLSGTSITFYMPFIDDSGVATRYITLDNLTINGVVAVPEPDPAIIGLIGMTALVIRRRR